MNPPFSNGAAHLLKAWEFVHNAEIVCLLNEETIKNPYTAERQKLAKIIERHGDVEFLGDCFSTAERKTGVNVAMVYLKKVAPDDTADLWAKEASREKDPGVQFGGDPTMLAIRDNLGNMEHWYDMANEHFLKGIEHIRKAKLYMNQNKVQDYTSGKQTHDFKEILGMALENVHTSRAEYLRRHRRLAWTSVFQQMEFNKWLDSKQQERFMRDVERDSTIPFTADNIKATLENVFLARHKLFEESVANVFDELTSHHAGNTNVKSEGWKTNHGHKVTERMIFPRGCGYDYGRFSCCSYNSSAATVYSDLDRVLCVLDAQPFDKCYTVHRALEHSFKLAGNGGGGFYNQIDSEYFTGRFFKKGTVHLKWKRLDLLEAFNKTAANGKKWLGENTQSQRPPKPHKSWSCEHNGHRFENNVCTDCYTLEVDPLDSIECDLCKLVAEYTGVTECPLHPSMLALGGIREDDAA
jgi:hypothetical protein